MLCLKSKVQLILNHTINHLNLETIILYDLKIN